MKFNQLCAVFLFAIAQFVFAESAKRPMNVEDQFRLLEPDLPLISPDGKWILYAVRQNSLSDNIRHSRTWLASADGAIPPKEFLREDDSSPMWAPNSRSVFFLRTVEGSSQLFEQNVEEKSAVQRSHLQHGADGSWQISRDGSHFLVVRDEPAPAAPGTSSDVIFVDEGSNGQTRECWQNLWRYDLNTETLTGITNREWSIADSDLSPDGNAAIVAARPDNQRNTRYKSELFKVDLVNGSVRQITHNMAPELNPRWSPDGSFVVFTAVLLDRWENGNGDLWSVDITSGQTKNLTPNHTGRFIPPLAFSPDGRWIFITGGYGTTRFPVKIEISSGRVTPLIRTEGSLRTGSWSKDASAFAYVYQDFTTPPDIYAGNTATSSDRQVRITNLNPWVRNEIDLGSVEVVHWTSFDKKAIEGLLYLPSEFAKSQEPLPMIVHVACGPGCAWLNQFSIKNHVYAGLGYAQFSANVRGTSNYDDRFMRANKFDIGGGDMRDLISGVDAMIARKIADPKQLGIDGWSYGAILSGYTLTKTTRFKAASLGAIVSDWPSEYGATANYDVELWFLGGNPWTKPNHWRERSSLTHADRIKTPVLLHHGDKDTTSSPFQSMNLFVALRKFGTTARLIRYPEEQHDLRQPIHLRIRDEQDVAWMQWFIRGIKMPEIIDGTPPR